MGGRGSGRHSGWGFLIDKCEDYRSIDLAWLRKQGLWTVGHCGTLTWSRGEEVIASIGYQIQANGLRLIYRTQRHGTEWRDVDDFILITTTATKFGGQRQWFVCPTCQRRCRVLFGGAYFRCRKCHGLKYESQYECAILRASSQRHKLRKRLGQVGSLEEPFAPKPKGMHWTTYERLKNKDAALSKTWAYKVTQWLRR